MKFFLVLALLMSFLSGCGAVDDLVASPGTEVVNGQTYATGTASAPAPQPGTDPATLPLTTIRVINTSEMPAADLAQYIADENAQLVVVGQVWGINVQLVAYDGSFDPSVPSIWISDNPNPIGIAANGQTYSNPGVEIRGGSVFYNYSEVASEQGNSGNYEDYFSHAGLLAGAGGPEIGEAYEAYAYGLVNGVPSQTPQYLCDWAFPAGGGTSPCTGVVSLDYAGYVPVGAAGENQ